MLSYFLKNSMLKYVKFFLFHSFSEKSYISTFYELNILGDLITAPIILREHLFPYILYSFFYQALKFHKKHLTFTLI